ncbi:group II intron reverse transcriptase/maturase [Aquincola tertiaricarbonis]|uniref:RNA-directed DNA polymerase n=2 Tax=Aquincola tertiaricarbonis TaxID=391953 RepID=A0ABY4SEQ8_AQUTE|nr:group II intron reverse transcriptase/maturase [Aquincola tertiaricarbonis]URI08202.1 group II intron reverse transcriptase/maturase [Aquincola tertiaricarbonis]URI10233.1 group II intron reverse transcriptase/maturase [Aquincola tertiaricarbonis]URI10758.1 group II intron reverse transcriptase/maturase [Aquincola tertiaricarbonis]
MALGSARHQTCARPTGRARRRGASGGEAAASARSDEARPARCDLTGPGADDLLGQALARANMAAAWKRIKANKGGAGVDGRTVQDTAVWLQGAWPAIRQSVLDGSYRPSAVRRVSIPKPGGGERELGIPTVVDRLIQQALLQVLQPLIDPCFSEHSHGFRPGRSAHGAVVEAKRYVQEGYDVVVDVDLEKFFDRVDHDIVMHRLSLHVADKRVLRLIRRYLQAPTMVAGVVSPRTQGTPQGGPLSPLLANVLLDEVDRELERRGHRFVRYADDCNVYVKSRKAGERVLQGLRKHYARLALKVNEAKTAVGEVWGRKFLGYCLWQDPTERGRRVDDGVRIGVARPVLAQLRQHLRGLTRRHSGCSLEHVAQGLREYLQGWKAYFRLAQTPRVFAAMDQWLRHRLRAIQFKQWKNVATVYREMRRLGATHPQAAAAAAHTGRWWRGSHHCLNNVLTIAYFDRLGVPRLA